MISQRAIYGTFNQDFDFNFRNDNKKNPMSVAAIDRLTKRANLRLCLEKKSVNNYQTMEGKLNSGKNSNFIFILSSNERLQPVIIHIKPPINKKKLHSVLENNI